MTDKVIEAFNNREIGLLLVLLEPKIRRIGISKVAKQMGIRRNNLILLLSEGKMYKFNTIVRLLEVLGYEVTLKVKNEKT